MKTLSLTYVRLIPSLKRVEQLGRLLFWRIFSKLIGEIGVLDLILVLLFFRSFHTYALLKTEKEIARKLILYVIRCIVQSAIISLAAFGLTALLTGKPFFNEGYIWLLILNRL